MSFVKLSGGLGLLAGPRGRASFLLHSSGAGEDLRGTCCPKSFAKDRCALELIF